MSDDFEVLLFYKYIKLDDPEAVRLWQKGLCEALNLKGRIIIAPEGINGTVEGLKKETRLYIRKVKEFLKFKDISFKKSIGSGQAFSKLSVKVREEIVATHFEKDVASRIQKVGKYVNADELHKWFEEEKEFYIVDMRNDYEQDGGYFKNSILSGFKQFYDLPEILPKIEHLKDKIIVPVCTGGVRCERASLFLEENGFNQVYQLKDGIHSYMQKYPNEHFKGVLYVFDNRLIVGFNLDNPERAVVGRCKMCQRPSENYVNCAYDFCHLHYICCPNCLDKETGLPFDKTECKQIFLQTGGTSKGLIRRTVEYIG